MFLIKTKFLRRIEASSNNSEEELIDDDDLDHLISDTDNERSSKPKEETSSKPPEKETTKLTNKSKSKGFFSREEEKLPSSAPLNGYSLIRDPFLSNSPKLKAYEYIQIDNKKALDEFGRFKLNHQK